MKIFSFLGSMALMLTVATSCSVHDPFADNGELGQVLPTVDWEQNSTDITAGNYATFTGKYYTAGDRQIDHSEVWALTKRSQTATATSKLTSSLAYTKTFSLTDTVRSAQCVAKFPHSAAVWNGHEYVLTDSFPTSRTLQSVVWASPEVWDQEKFEQYYPATFAQEFVNHMVEALTKDMTYYNDLRGVYVKYDFTAEQFSSLAAKHGVTFPADVSTDKKSDNWFTQVKNEKGEMEYATDHYYYTTVENGVSTDHEIATQEEAPAGVSVYPVYKSSSWLYCRYSDDTGGAVTSVRAAYIPFFKELLGSIPFSGWIYDSADKVYNLNYNRVYMLQPSFRVFDTNGKMGVSSDNKEITLK